MRKPTLAVFFATLLIACSSNPSKPAGEQSKPAAEAAKPVAPQLETGRNAIQRLYATAHMWAPDARPFLLESQSTKEIEGQGGKAAVWRGSFASPSRRSIKTWVWSGIKADDAPSPGTTPGSEDTYNPANASTQVFDLAYLKVDSDQAFETAQKHGGEKLLKKTPKTPVTYALDWKPASNELIWHVLYGDANEPSLRIAVNATTGAFMRVEK